VQTKERERSVGEMEQEFLDAMRSFYYDGQASISNEEFDALKEELMWEGSQVVILSAAEQKFLEACMAYAKGKPVISDEEYEALKLELKRQGSQVTSEGPRCSLRSGKMYADASPDYVKMALVNIPALFATLTAVALLDYFSGRAVTYAVELPGAPGFLFTWAILIPAIYTMTTGITNFVVRDWVIVKSTCPNCGAENSAFFGDVFVVSGPKDVVTTDCAGCQSQLQWDNDSRNVSVERVGPAKKGGPGGAKAARDDN
jgi:hypothetical protein